MSLISQIAKQEKNELMQQSQYLRVDEEGSWSPSGCSHEKYTAFMLLLIMVARKRRPQIPLMTADLYLCMSYCVSGGGKR